MEELHDVAPREGVEGDGDDVCWALERNVWRVWGSTGQLSGRAGSVGLAIALTG